MSFSFFISSSYQNISLSLSCCPVGKMYVWKEVMHEYISKDIFASWRNPAVALPRRLLNVLIVALPFSIFWLLLSRDRLPSFSIRPARTTMTHWHGWANIENLFVLYAANCQHEGQ